MSDLESQLPRALRTYADSAFPDDAPVPPLDLDRAPDAVVPTQHSGWRRYRTPLLAAAAVLIIAAGTGILIALRDKPAPAGAGWGHRVDDPGAADRVVRQRELRGVD